jgi:CRP-like cAMP-binding protein
MNRSAAVREGYPRGVSGGGHISSALTQCALFYGRPIHALVPTCSAHTYAAGKPIFRPGEPAVPLVVLAAGRANTFALRRNGDEHSVLQYRAPQALVEVGIFTTDRTRRLGATAVTDVDAVLVPHDALLRAAADDPVLAGRLLTMMADSAAGPRASIGDEVSARVLACLEDVARSFGVRQPDGSVLIGLRLTHAEIGGLIAATGPAVSRAIKVLVAAEQIERVGDYYLVTAPTEV